MKLEADNLSLQLGGRERGSSDHYSGKKWGWKNDAFKNHCRTLYAGSRNLNGGRQKPIQAFRTGTGKTDFICASGLSGNGLSGSGICGNGEKSLSEILADAWKKGL